jgi:GNAT superfamily N-acetyltransferase
VIRVAAKAPLLHTQWRLRQSIQQALHPSSKLLTTHFDIRPASLADVPTLARHRAEMFRDIHAIDDAQYEAMVDASRRYFETALPGGEYLAWLAEPVSSPGKVVAGAGLQLRRALPSIRHGTGDPRVITGPQGLILNVFTERAWRRRGLARQLMENVIAGARRAGVATLVLHASAEGRPLYEALGFKATNEMRYTGEL